MNYIQYLLLGFLVICAISVSFSKNLLRSILIYMSYSLIMSVLWITLQSPDLAITEAAVGAGVTSVLFFVTLKKIHAMKDVETVKKVTGEEHPVGVSRNSTTDVYTDVSGEAAEKSTENISGGDAHE